MLMLVIAVLPVLYLLSAPLISAFVAASAIRTRGDPQPDWLHYFELPYRTLADNTPLKGILDEYDLWCWRAAGLLP